MDAVIEGLSFGTLREQPEHLMHSLLFTFTIA